MSIFNVIKSVGKTVAKNVVRTVKSKTKTIIQKDTKPLIAATKKSVEITKNIINRETQKIVTKATSSIKGYLVNLLKDEFTKVEGVKEIDKVIGTISDIKNATQKKITEPQQRERGFVTSELIASLNKKDGEKMANNLIKSLNNSIENAKMFSQNTTKIRKALQDFQRLCNEIGYANAGNYVYYLMETNALDEISFTNLFSSDSELLGEVTIDTTFVDFLNNKKEINTFLSYLKLVEGELF